MSHAANTRRRGLLSLLAGPVFEKEMRCAGRRRSTFWYRAVYAMGLVSLVSLVFLGSTGSLEVQSSAAGLQGLQRMSVSVCMTVAWFQYILLLLLSMVLTCPAINEEKRSGTLSTLLTTPLTAWQITLGKMGAPLVQLMSMALLSLPLLLAVRVFGGVTAELIIASSVMMLATTFLAGSLGYLFSILQKRPTTAFASALAAFLFLQFIPSFAVFTLGMLWGKLSFLQGNPPAPFGLPLEVIAAGLSGPIIFGGSMLMVLAPTATMPDEFRWFWMSSAVLLCIEGAVVLFIATAFLRRLLRREAAGAVPSGLAPAATAPAAAQGGAPAPATPAQAAAGRRRAVRSGKGVDALKDNPVLWRELRISLFQKKIVLFAIFGAALLLLAWAYWIGGYSDEVVQYPIFVISTVLAVLLAAGGATGAFSGERESRTWEVLLTTPLTAEQITRGKYLGILRRQWILPAIFLMHMALSGYLLPLVENLPNYFFPTVGGSSNGFAHPVVPIAALLIMAGPLVLLSATGLFYSLLVKKSVLAGVLNVGTALLIWAGLPLSVVILSELVLGNRIFEPLMSAVGIINPFAMMVVTAEGGMPKRYSGVADAQFELFDFGSVGPVGYLITCLLIFGVYAAAAFGVYRLTVSILRGRTQRRT